MSFCINIFIQFLSNNKVLTRVNLGKHKLLNDRTVFLSMRCAGWDQVIYFILKTRINFEQVAKLWLLDKPNKQTSEYCYDCHSLEPMEVKGFYYFSASDADGSSLPQLAWDKRHCCCC
jgi:hypothetical protein